MKRCPTCYNEYEDRYAFCQKDGATLFIVAESYGSGTAAAAPARAFTAPSEMPFNQQAASIGSVVTADSQKLTAVFAQHRVPILIGLAVVMAAVVALVVYLAFPSAKSTILSEISKGNLVKPEGSSAYDLYLKSKSNLSASDMAAIANQVTPMLENRGDQILTRFKQDTTESEIDWAEAIRLYSWLNDLRPKPAYESRRYFSQARLEFLKKDYNRAIADFQRSSQLESTWALPLNGLGRAYVNISDKANAREYYRRACEAESNWIYPWINLGALSLDMSDYRTAEESLNRALTLDANKASAHYLLGQTCEKTERWCDASAHYRQALANAGNTAAPGFNIDAVRSKIDRLAAKYHCG